MKEKGKKIVMETFGLGLYFYQENRMKEKGKKIVMETFGLGLYLYQENRMKEKGKKIVMDPKAALRKGLNIIKDCR